MQQAYSKFFKAINSLNSLNQEEMDSFFLDEMDFVIAPLYR